MSQEKDSPKKEENKEHKKGGRKGGGGNGGRGRRQKKKFDPGNEFVLFHGVEVRQKNLSQLQKWEKMRKTATDAYFYKYWIVRKVHKKESKKEEEECELGLFEPKENISYKITEDIEEANEWVRKYILEKGVKAVGVDTEHDLVKPLPGKGHATPLFPDLIQVSTAESCLLFRTDEGFTKPPEEIIKIFVDKNYSKLFCDSLADFGSIRRYFKFHGHSTLDYEVPKNCKQRRNFRQNYLEENFGCINVDPNRKGLKGLTQEYFKRTLNKSKALTCSRWSTEVLDSNQIEYAINDALLPLLLYQDENCRLGEEEFRKSQSKENKNKKKAQESEKKEEEEETEGEEIQKEGKVSGNKNVTTE